MLSASMYDLSPASSTSQPSAVHGPHSSAAGSSLFLSGQSTAAAARPPTPPPPAEQLGLSQPGSSADYSSHPSFSTLANTLPSAQLSLNIKSEPTSNGMFSNYDFMGSAWLSSQVNALASLKALMHANEAAGSMSTVPELFSARLAAAAAAAAAASANAPSSASPSTAASIGNDEEFRPAVGLDHVADTVKFPTEFASNATACTTTAGAPLSAADAIPRKQDIQTDIRMNKGRFHLVRKRGRSEVWNLFGQVIDTVTGNRLPYVACYACKVLYTDTGGGTGNMTRHRCSMGNSYRTLTMGNSTTSKSVADKSVQQTNNISTCSEPAVTRTSLHTSSSHAGRGSSLDSMSSFDAPVVSMQMDSTSPTSAAAAAATAVFNASAAREAFIRSGNNSGGSGGTISSGFVSASVGSVGSHSFLHSADSLTSGPSPFLFHQIRQQQQAAQQQTSLHNSFAANSALAQMGRSLAALLPLAPFGAVPTSGSSTASDAVSPLPGGDFSTSGPTLAGFASAFNTQTSLASSQSNISSSRRLSAASTTAVGSGYVFTATDKQLFANAVLQFCAIDLHNYDVVEGDGFRNLIETALFIGRRSHDASAAASPTGRFDPVRTLIPTARQMRNMINVQDSYVRQATLSDLRVAKSANVALSAQTIRYAGDYYLAVFADYVTDDWRLTQRVRACVNGSADAGASELTAFVAKLLNDCSLEGARCILLAVDASLDVNYAHIATEVRQMLPEGVLVVRSAKRALNRILHDALAACDSSAHDAVNALTGVCKRVMRALRVNETIDGLPPAGVTDEDDLSDYVDTVYATVKWIGDHLAQVRIVLVRDGQTQLLADLDQLNWPLARELLTFLQSFYETAQIFKDSKNPHAQKILPEWHALIHECDELAGSSPSATASAVRGDFDAFEPRRAAHAYGAPRHSHSTLSSSSGASEERISRGSAANDATTADYMVDAALDRAARFSLRSGISVEMSGLFRSKSRSITPKWDEDESGGDAPPPSAAVRRRPFLRDVHMSSIISADGIDDEEENKDNINNNNNNESNNGNSQNNNRADNTNVEEGPRGCEEHNNSTMQIEDASTPELADERNITPVEVKTERSELDNILDDDAESKQSISEVGGNEWLLRARRVANTQLQLWARDHILLEQKIATVLNPRLRHLNVICSHSERLAVYARIRELAGLNDRKRNLHNHDASTDEPACKRREFLDRLEDCAAEEDELDVYLRAAFPSNLTRDVLEFWSSSGDTEFPRLARLARFLLATKGAVEPLALATPSTPLSAKDLCTLLTLKPEVLDSMNRSQSMNPIKTFQPRPKSMLTHQF